MSRIIRTTLQCLSLAFACATCAHAAQAQGNRTAKLDFASCAKPTYPHADVQARHQGTVKLGFLVDATGRVKESKVTSSSGFATLDEAARTALETCSFHPAQANGKPVEQWTTVQYVWTLQ